MSLFTVGDSCIQCGICAEICPACIINFDDGGKPYVQETQEGTCIRCGQCVSFCPESCCNLDLQLGEEKIPVKTDILPTTESAEVFLRSRRSIRRFKETPPDRETVRRIIDTTRYAPSASNKQPVRWVVTNGREKTTELAELTAGFFERSAGDEPDGRGMSATISSAWRSGVDIIFRGAPLLAVAVVDGSHNFPEDGTIALTYFELAAHAMGVGCCWAGLFTIAARKDGAIQRAVGISDTEIVVGGQMLGYPRDIGICRILPPRRRARIDWI